MIDQYTFVSIENQVIKKIYYYNSRNKYLYPVGQLDDNKVGSRDNRNNRNGRNNDRENNRNRVGNYNTKDNDNNNVNKGGEKKYSRNDKNSLFFKKR